MHSKKQSWDAPHLKIAMQWYDDLAMWTIPWNRTRAPEGHRQMESQNIFRQKDAGFSAILLPPYCFHIVDSRDSRAAVVSGAHSGAVVCAADNA